MGFWCCLSLGTQRSSLLKEASRRNTLMGVRLLLISFSYHAHVNYSLADPSLVADGLYVRFDTT